MIEGRSEELMKRESRKETATKADLFIRERTGRLDGQIGTTAQLHTVNVLGGTASGRHRAELANEHMQRTARRRRLAKLPEEGGQPRAARSRRIRFRPGPSRVHSAFPIARMTMAFPSAVSEKQARTQRLTYGSQRRGQDESSRCSGSRKVGGGSGKFVRRGAALFSARLSFSDVHAASQRKMDASECFTMLILHGTPAGYTRMQIPEKVPLLLLIGGVVQSLGSGKGGSLRCRGRSSAPPTGLFFPHVFESCAQSWYGHELSLQGLAQRVSMRDRTD